ncbi:ferrochelatase [Paenibacillus koleovorans]|uniref:ferrochelatase n=1 Tax=Paenibacillus koleovorans TaxID=121608 RepID=UPI000FD90F63|nr:ferrochelatase [Paenibacillus koleovorans]
MPTTNRTIGVLVMSYGTPESMDQIEAYYTHIRRGHPPTPEQLQELTDRYEAIVGGFFPLRENTNKQVAALEEALNQAYAEQGLSFKCYQGLKHASPFIEDGVRQMAEDGIREAVGIVLAPHYSVMSVGGYIKRAQEAVEGLDLTLRFVRSYHLHPELIQALSERVTSALERFEESERSSVRVIFSAHSLPAKILEMNDPYPDQMLETSRAIAERTGISSWQFAWQSAGRTATPWLGPDIMDVLVTAHREEGVKRVLVCPIGFVSDHLEVLYDIDIECQHKARELGMQLERTESLNTDPLYMKTLSDVIGAQL